MACDDPSWDFSLRNIVSNNTSWPFLIFVDGLLFDQVWREIVETVSRSSDTEVPLLKLSLKMGMSVWELLSACPTVSKVLGIVLPAVHMKPG